MARADENGIKTRPGTPCDVTVRPHVELVINELPVAIEENPILEPRQSVPETAVPCASHPIFM